MSDNGDGFERTKLKKQLTQRMRKNKDNKGAPKAVTSSAAAEETKSTVSKSSASKKASWGMPSVVKHYAPTYLTQRPSSKMLFDVAFFSAAAFIIYKFGKQMNDSIAQFVPTEASLRQ